jgi:D-arginine utilization repressor
MTKNRVSDEIKPYIPMVQALIELFHPFIEVAIHDLKQGKIIALYHTISRRKVGDPSPLHELKLPVDKFPDYFSPYTKTNWDGKELKCVSVTIRDEAGQPIGLICFNADISFFQHVQKTIGSFLKVEQEAENPLVMFSENWKEKISNLIEEYLREKQLGKEYLDKSERKALVKYLFEKGVFHFKNAAPYIAHYLGMSRASIYNYLKAELK